MDDFSKLMLIKALKQEKVFELSTVKTTLLLHCNDAQLF